QVKGINRLLVIANREEILVRSWIFGIGRSSQGKPNGLSLPVPGNGPRNIGHNQLTFFKPARKPLNEVRIVRGPDDGWCLGRRENKKQGQAGYGHEYTGHNGA